MMSTNDERVLASTISTPPTLPCANVQAEKYVVCKNSGKCKLVSYCSKECQKCTGKHKQDCNNPTRFTGLKTYVAQETSVFVILKKIHFQSIKAVPYVGLRLLPLTRHRLSQMIPRKTGSVIYRRTKSLGMALWGNTPVVDTINLACNERPLAFISATYGNSRHNVLSKGSTSKRGAQYLTTHSRAFEVLTLRFQMGFGYLIIVAAN